ncbi:anti-sigma factor [Candidatus Deferrimicrobium sp.]|uniref:anti-sigma factor family protein n=1 Tax=Candidatus Deferrimicrobium sp. TaxID=3060586 RepID=UPI002724E577|nr:zf-HC2 domain-containing protein [Candidatus Deferrimicrobium sp.]MDO8738574.1 zf-HC2 domain-containing protein [Candidatus Deferrimicrobium sp.]
MDCRETQTLLTAFHDGELPAADRARVEEHLRGCAGCGALLADLERVDQAAGVPDPGPAYWDRFNTRVMDRVEREADGPRVAVLRPKHGWMRQQLRYLVPAAAAAALVVVVVRYGGMNPGAPIPTVPPSVSEPAAPVLPNERFAAVTREDRGRLADRSVPAGNVEASRDRAGAPAGSSSVTAADGMSSRRQAEQEKMEGATALMANESRSASPCELARTLAERERFREAEVAQRACLAGNLPEPAREKGLVFLAELLDRQARFAEADAVITEVDLQFPQSRPLDLYRQRRPMEQKRQE